MKLIAGSIACLLIGLGSGWYLGYTRPTAKVNRDARQYLSEMEHDDRMTVAVAVAAIRDLENERSQQAKELLARQLGSYYVIYGPSDHPKKRRSEDCLQMLRKIEEFARTYPVVQAAIDKSKQNLRK